jgi:DNA-binding winged helix-turn-helix (wHTH) protein/TolB-like protein
MTRQVKHLYEFGPFQIDVGNRLLLRAGEPVPLTIKAFDTLLFLVENSGRVLEKDELMRMVWPDTAVEENNLTQNISALRKVIGDDPAGRKYIETLPRRGYRFAAAVNEIWGDGPDLILEKQTRSRIVIEQESDHEPRTEIAAAGSPATASPAPAIAHKFTQRWKLAAVSFLVIGIAAGAYIWGSSAPRARTLAVLPFKPLAAGDSDPYLELGMADALITRLSNIKQITVRPTSSVLKFATGPDPVAAGRELGVESVLDGSVQRSGDKIRITVRLVRVSDGASLWADTFDENFTNIFRVQDAISERMAGALALKLTGEEKKSIAKRYTDNTEAYQEYLKGRFYWAKWSPASLRTAIVHFEAAIKEDSAYAPAYSGVAISYNLLGYIGAMPPREAYPKGEAAALKALAIDDTLGETRVPLAEKKLFYDWDFDGAKRELDTALKLSPSFPHAYALLGAYWLAVGRFDEALAARKRAQELDPITPLSIIGVAWVYYYDHKNEQAIEQTKKALDLDPHLALAHGTLGNAYHLNKLYAEAVDEYLREKELSGAKPEHLAALKQAYSTSGIRGYWEKELELANERLKQGPVGVMQMVRIYTELGEKARALEWLEKAYEERTSLLAFLNVIPHFESLHSEPGFQDLLRRIGLTP